MQTYGHIVTWYSFKYAVDRFDSQKISMYTFRYSYNTIRVLKVADFVPKLPM